MLVEDIGFPEIALEGEEEESGRPERAFAYEKKISAIFLGEKQIPIKERLEKY